MFSCTWLSGRATRRSRNRLGNPRRIWRKFDPSLLSSNLGIVLCFSTFLICFRVSSYRCFGEGIKMARKRRLRSCLSDMKNTILLLPSRHRKSRLRGSTFFEHHRPYPRRCRTAMFAVADLIPLNIAPLRSFLMNITERSAASLPRVNRMRHANQTARLNP